VTVSEMASGSKLVMELAMALATALGSKLAMVSVTVLAMVLEKRSGK
jgi:hypothetical protein